MFQKLTEIKKFGNSQVRKLRFLQFIKNFDHSKFVVHKKLYKMAFEIRTEYFSYQLNNYFKSCVENLKISKNVKIRRFFFKQKWFKMKKFFVIAIGFLIEANHLENQCFTLKIKVTFWKTRFHFENQGSTLKNKVSLWRTRLHPKKQG